MDKIKVWQIKTSQTIINKGKSDKLAFTLVELIVVITILAILWTIAFISLQWYSKEARDSTRITDISSMKTGLELFQLWAGKYPLPTDWDEITYSWGLVWTQWTFWDTTFKNVWSIDKIPLDPITDKEYVYSTTNTRQEYQIAWVLEWEIANNSHLTPLLRVRGGQLEASEKTGLLKIWWNYNWKMLKVSTWWTDYVLALPSLLSMSGWLTDLLDIATNNALVYNWYKNLPYQFAWNYNTIWEWSWLNLINVSKIQVFSWSLKDLSDGETAWVTARANLLTALQEAYNWTAIKQVAEIDQILSTTDSNEIELLMTSIVSNNLWWSVVASGWGNVWWWEVLTWWRALDPNCDIDDILIWTQTWAWCNSTLWTWFEYWQLDSDIWNGTYNWTVSDCYDYSWNNTATCTKWDITMASNTKANTWFSGTNSNLDSEYANIWWKFYTWSNSPSACPTWRHVPSDAEWTTLEQHLWCPPSDATRNWWWCIWLWWMLHDNISKDETNNLSNALKLTLWGNSNSSRGSSTYLWSSTDSTTNSYIRRVIWDYESVWRELLSQTTGASVRCIKN